MICQIFTIFRNNNDYLKMTLSHILLQIFITSFKRTYEVSFYKNCIILKILKQIEHQILQNGSMFHIKISNNLYVYVLDIIDTKTYKFKQMSVSLITML